MAMIRTYSQCFEKRRTLLIEDIDNKDDSFLHVFDFEDEALAWVQSIE